MDQAGRTKLLDAARKGIDQFLQLARAEGRIDEQSFQDASRSVYPALESWLSNDDLTRVSPQLHEGIAKAIEEQRWEDLVNSFRQSIRFGTGGIRGMMAFDRGSIEKMFHEGIGAPILKGTNTINDVVLLLTSAGVAQFGKQQNPPFTKVAIGYDSRVRGQDFAKLVAELFLHYGYTVFFFDEPCPYPEITYAIPYVQADIGILISASHNDYRYNGYKLSCSNGSQFDPEQRDEMYNKYIANATIGDVHLLPFEQAPKDQLVFLGGDELVEGFNYLGRENDVVNVHKQHSDHVKSFLMTDDLRAQQQNASDPLHIAFCAFHGAGRRAVPRMLREAGFNDIRSITRGGLNDLNGLFPSFESAPGKEQQPDPGDIRAATTAVNAYKEQEHELGAFDEVDILIGTDPDADRCGVVVKVPENQRGLYGGSDWTLLSADNMWALLLWYRMHREQEKFGHVVDADKKFIVLSHTTSDCITLMARKYGLGVIKTWVGFASLAAAVRDAWENRPMLPLVEGRLPAGFDPPPEFAKLKTQELCHPFICEYQGMDDSPRSINVGAMEQSNGFSLLGGPPPDNRSLGAGGHVRDKDGTLAALLIAEIAAWAKAQGSSLYELIDEHIHKDPDIGLFVNYYEPDPLDGEYPGIQGDSKKKDILRRALGYFQLALAGDLTLGGRKVIAALIYRTGKYDAIYKPTYDFRFPDEGVRFFLDGPGAESRLNHLTVRPSGTGNSLRFHVQLHEPAPGEQLIEKKRQLMADAKRVTDEIRQILKAPR